MRNKQKFWAVAFSLIFSAPPSG